MFAKIFGAIIGAGGGVISDLEKAVSDFKADKTNPQKAVTVATALLAVVEAVAPFL